MEVRAMTKSMGMIEARRRLTSLPEEFAKEPELGAVEVLRRGKPVLAVMPWELYEAVLETMEIFSDVDQMEALRKGLRDIEEGRIYTSEEVKKDLDR
jgi:antitoxin YefM